jgi:hypothetical protein
MMKYGSATRWSRTGGRHDFLIVGKIILQVNGVIVGKDLKDTISSGHVEINRSQIHRLSLQGMNRSCCSYRENRICVTNKTTPFNMVISGKVVIEKIPSGTDRTPNDLTGLHHLLQQCLATQLVDRMTTIQLVDRNEPTDRDQFLILMSRSKSLPRKHRVGGKKLLSIGT